jgi:hypothetical protein
MCGIASLCNSADRIYVHSDDEVRCESCYTGPYHSIELLSLYGSNEELDEVVTPPRATPLRSAESATAAAMPALVDHEAV